MSEDDLDLLIDNIDELKDAIYLDEKEIDVVENTIKHLNNKYNLLSQKKEIKEASLVNFFKLFLLETSISYFVVFLFSFLINLNFGIVGIISTIIFIITNTKKCLKDTKEIRTLEKSTSLEKILEDIQIQEDNLKKINNELLYSKDQLKCLDEEIKYAKNVIPIKDSNLDLEPQYVLSRIKKIN